MTAARTLLPPLGEIRSSKAHFGHIRGPSFPTVKSCGGVSSGGVTPPHPPRLIWSVNSTRGREKESPIALKEALSNDRGPPSRAETEARPVRIGFPIVPRRAHGAKGRRRRRHGEIGPIDRSIDRSCGRARQSTRWRGPLMPLVTSQRARGSMMPARRAVDQSGLERHRAVSRDTRPSACRPVKKEPSPGMGRRCPPLSRRNNTTSRHQKALRFSRSVMPCRIKREVPTESPEPGDVQRYRDMTPDSVLFRRMRSQRPRKMPTKRDGRRRVA